VIQSATTYDENYGSRCGQCAVVSYGGKSVTVRIEDRCEGCPVGGIDLSESAFSQLADLGTVSFCLFGMREAHTKMFPST
jgi:hypothetical protein